MLDFYLYETLPTRVWLALARFFYLIPPSHGGAPTELRPNKSSSWARVNIPCSDVSLFFSFRANEWWRIKISDIPWSFYLCIHSALLFNFVFRCLNQMKEAKLKKVNHLIPPLQIKVTPAIFHEMSTNRVSFALIISLELLKWNKWQGHESHLIRNSESTGAGNLPHTSSKCSELRSK